MSRNKGTASFASNYEVHKSAPLDAKQLCGLKSDLVSATAFLGNDGNDYTYVGMLVSVASDPIILNNGVYRLKSLPATNVSNWEQIGSVTDVNMFYDKELVTKTLYLSPTGSDTTGDGTLALPYFSIHKAISTLKTIIDAPIIIQAASGTYDFTSLGTLYFNRFLFTTNGSIVIRNNTTVALSTTSVNTGTFTNHSLLQRGPGATDLSEFGVIHNRTAAGWTAGGFEGMLCQVLTMMNGHALPSTAYRYLPILENGADWIETAPAYTSAAVSEIRYQDIANYDIRSYNVTFNFGNNKIVWSQSAGFIQFLTVKIIGLQSLSIAGLEGVLSSAKLPTFTYCSITFVSGANNKDYSASTLYQWCYVNFGVSTGNLLGTIQGCAIKSSATGTGNVTPISIGGTFTGNNMLCTNATKPEYAVMWGGRLNIGGGARMGLRDISKITGTLNGVHTKNGTTSFFNTGGTWIVDTTCKFFLQLANQNTQLLTSGIFDVSFPLTFLPNEPTIGRVTWDGVTEITNYYDLQRGWNLLTIAPTVQQWNPNDVYVGGYKSVLDIIERDAIIPEIRKIGMMVKTNGDGKYYTLVNGILNTDWVEQEMGEGAGGPQLYTTVTCATTYGMNISTAFTPGSMVDNISLVAGDTILAKNQADPSENGIWVCDAVPYRRADYMSDDSIRASVVSVKSGDPQYFNGIKSYRNINTSPITVGTTAINYRLIVNVDPSLDAGTWAPKNSFVKWLDTTFTYEYDTRELLEFEGTPSGPNLSDWYLPSIEELLLVQQNIYEHGLGNFNISQQYWSSTESGFTPNTSALSLSMNQSGVEYNSSKSSQITFRAVRHFVDDAAKYRLRERGPANGWIYYIDSTVPATPTYYEVAPVDQVTEWPWEVWSNITNNVVGTSRLMGTGQANTLAIIAQGSHTTSAARGCDLYSTAQYTQHILKPKYNKTIVGTGGTSFWEETGTDYVTPLNSKIPNSRNINLSGLNSKVTKEGNNFLYEFNPPQNAGLITPLGRNLFLGYQVGNETLGSTAIVEDSSSHNVGIGSSTLSSLTLGHSNVGIGRNALLSLLSGQNNVAIGEDALRNNIEGSFNVAIGEDCLTSINTAQSSYNQVIGKNGFRYATFVQDSIGIGYGVGSGYGPHPATAIGQVLTVEKCVYIGDSIRGSSANVVNEIVIGAYTLGRGNNTVLIGNENITDTYLRGNVHTEGSVRVGDDSDTPSVSNEGKIRYRKGVNFSVAEMVMQTGATTYAWVEIKRNDWV